MVSDNSYINLYMVEYNVIYLYGLTHHILTRLNPHEFDASNVTTKMQEK